MTALIPFTFENRPVRSALIDGAPWFVARDVAEALGVGWRGDTLDAIKPEWKGMRRFRTPSSGDRGGGEQELAVIAEAGVYKLAFRSRKAAAERFTDWLAGEVLPAIRKTGRYDQAARPDLRLAQRVNIACYAAAMIAKGDPDAYDDYLETVFERLSRKKSVRKNMMITARLSGHDSGLSGFLAACVEEALGETTTARTLYLAYSRWSEGRGEPPVSETLFGRRMAAHWRRENRRGVKTYPGLRLKQGAPSPARSPKEEQDEG